MTQLFGQDVALADIRAQTGDMTQVAGIQLVSLEDGPSPLYGVEGLALSPSTARGSPSRRRRGEAPPAAQHLRNPTRRRLAANAVRRP